MCTVVSGLSFVCKSCVTRHTHLRSAVSNSTNSLLFSLTRLNQKESKTLVVRSLEKEPKVMVRLVLFKEKRKETQKLLRWKGTVQGRNKGRVPIGLLKACGHKQ